MEDILVYLSVINNGNWNLIYQNILEKRPINKEDVKKEIEKLNVKWITLLSKNYPSFLKSIFKPPFVLFYEGDINLLSEDSKRIAVIGSRFNSQYGLKTTQKICKGLLEKNITIVSGLAKGIDGIAHNSCLDNNGKTIAVIGNGLNVIYPKENQKLYERIKENGLIISEYPPNTMPNPSNFPTRNRIIAAISGGILVIEAKEKSGTMNTVAHALEDGKQIFCVPERCDENSGCNKLIKEGAKLVETATDILEEL